MKDCCVFVQVMCQLIGFPSVGVTTHKNNGKILVIRRLGVSQMCFVFNAADLFIYFFAYVWSFYQFFMWVNDTPVLDFW